MLFETDKCGMIKLVRKLTVEDFKISDDQPHVCDYYSGGDITIVQSAALVNPEGFTQEELKVFLSDGYTDKINTEIKIDQRTEFSLKGIRKDAQDAKIRAAKDKAGKNFNPAEALAKRVEAINGRLEKHVEQTNKEIRWKLLQQYRDLNAWQYKDEELDAMSKEHGEVIAKLREIRKKQRELKEKKLRNLIETTDKLTDELRTEILAKVDADGFQDNAPFHF